MLRSSPDSYRLSEWTVGEGATTPNDNFLALLRNRIVTITSVFDERLLCRDFMNPDQHQHALNHREMLHWYEIKSILGQGGFGITYLARDTNLNHDVAIKEYLPLEYATRTASRAVEPISDNHAEIFEWGKTRFLDEARTLFQFKHPNIVRVLSFFEHNNTGYMVMEREEGNELSDFIKAREYFDEARLQNIVLPILDGLDQVHAAGYIHRDIKPQNIMIRKDGSPVLIDFGSARQAMGEQTHTLTTMVTPGYAPLEQYHEAVGNQGPWTDIYALGATLYAAITGEAPADALKRSMARAEQNSDAYLPLVDLKGDEYSAGFLQAIDHALEFAAKKRPQNVRDWSKMLRGVTPVLPPDSDTQIYMGPAVSDVGKSAGQKSPATTQAPAAALRKMSSGFLSVILVLVVAAAAFAFLRQDKFVSQHPAEEFVESVPEDSIDSISEQLPVSVQPLDTDAHEINKELKAEKARLEAAAREAAEKLRLQEEATRAAEAAAREAEEEQRKEELARLAMEERKLLEEALAAEQQRRQAYEAQQKEIQAEAEVTAFLYRVLGSWEIAVPDAAEAESFRLSIRNDNSAIYEQGNGRVWFTSVDDGSELQGYWVQALSPVRCQEMKNGSWHWGNSTLRFENNYSQLEWIRNYCGTGEKHVYNGNRQ